MPIYEYQCLSCERVSEFFLRVSDPHPDTCPKCGRQAELKKQISQTSFSLRGEGWYVTDYKPGKKESAESVKAETQSDATATDGVKPADLKSTVEKPAAGAENVSAPATKARVATSSEPAVEAKGK